DWHAVGAPYSLPVHLLALSGLSLPSDVSLANNVQAPATVATADALLRAVRTQTGSVALVPMELADWSVRNLGVDGVYPAQGRGDGTFAQLTLRIGAANKLVARGLDMRLLGTSLTAALAPTVPT